MEKKSDLADLPNIGKEAAEWLVKAGINTTAELKKIGSIEAARRIRKLRPQDPPCRSMLSGLEGAIRGVRWHAIPKADRDKLWREYERRAAQ